MDLFEDIRKYLPQFLSKKTSDELFTCLKDFPENMDSRLYCDYLKSESFFTQGDGVFQLKFVRWDNNSLRDASAIIISNTCDISKENERVIPPYCAYCLILDFGKYLNTLKKNGKDENYIKQLEYDIKRQAITSIFYLPKGHDFEKDYIALLDHVGSCPITHLDAAKTKIFSLSNYGFYMFLLKLSIHFTRIRDGLDRSDLNDSAIN